MRRFLPITFAVAAAFAALGCGDFGTTVRPTEVTLTACTAGSFPCAKLTTAKVGQQIDFRYAAQGRSMAGLIIEYGDGTPPDSVNLSGAVTATGFKTHTYSMPSSYFVSARLEDFVAGTATSEFTFPITP